MKKQYRICTLHMGRIFILDELYWNNVVVDTEDEAILMVKNLMELHPNTYFIIPQYTSDAPNR